MSNFKFNNTVSMFQNVSSYGWEKVQLHTADHPMALLQKYNEITTARRQLKAASSPFLSQMTAKLDRILRNKPLNKGSLQISRIIWSNNSNLEEAEATPQS